MLVAWGYGATHTREPPSSGNEVYRTAHGIYCREGRLDKTGPSVASKGISVHPTHVQKYLTASVLAKYPVVVEIISWNSDSPSEIQPKP